MLHSDFLNHELFTHLAIREKEILKGNSAMLTFTEEELLFKKDSFSSCIYFVQEGCIKLKKDDGELFFLLEENEILGLDDLFNDQPIYYSAYAAKGSRIIQISVNAIRNSVSANSMFLSAVSRKNSEINQNLILFLLEYRSRKIHGAFASVLLHFEGSHYLDDLTRKEIGELIGYSRENVTKVLRTFISEGIIEEKGKHIHILDRKRLETLRKKG